MNYLSLCWPFILREYWPQLLFYDGLFIATLIFGYATLARVLGLAHLGQKVDFIELSIRRGHGDFGLAGALRRGEEGERQRINSRADPYGPLECRGRLAQPTYFARKWNERVPSLLQ